MPRINTDQLLPADFHVYAGRGVVVNHPGIGLEEKTLPTINHYKGKNGGYVAIYTGNAEKGVYGVGGGIYVVGQVRVPGHYEGRYFIPAGYNSDDNINHDPEILKICEQYFPDMKGEMWIGGDTGGWFGIQ
ncbi:MAG: hypothetical protein KGQ49_05405 [Verrucomicrobia bacterium]|nr:hypothetical protein [Verrucomicrobiota bacterium]MBU6446816.1 hypothetical protein [Verrucomicrobiota bacterium]MDE3047088.1 hypothetical protein [Verrucomicrobiota bacterium]